MRGSRPFRMSGKIESELETCLRFPVSENHSRKLQSESTFLSPLLPTVQFDVVHNTSTFDTSSTPTPVDSMSCIFTFLFLSVRWILRIHSDSGNFCFQGFFIFLISHFDICTIFSNWFDVITNWCNVSIQSFRWSSERTALPSTFPDC